MGIWKCPNKGKIRERERQTRTERHIAMEKRQSDEKRQISAIGRCRRRSVHADMR
jgi:hypothetical protein